MAADARACTGVLGIHPMSRDIKIDNFSVTFHGSELLQDTKLELSCGQRYGLIGANGSGKKDPTEISRPKSWQLHSVTNFPHDLFQFYTLARSKLYWPLFTWIHPPVGFRLIMVQTLDSFLVPWAKSQPFFGS